MQTATHTLTTPARLRLVAVSFAACLLLWFGAVGRAQSGPPPLPPGDAADSNGSTSAGSTGGGTESGMGQSRRPGPPSPATELDRIIRAMKSAAVPLSDTQKVAILGILEDKETAQQSARSSTDRASAMQSMRSLDATARTAILAVLTEAQQKVYSSLRQGPPAGGGAPGQNSANGDAGSPPDSSSSGGPPQGAPPTPPQ